MHKQGRRRRKSRKYLSVEILEPRRLLSAGIPDLTFDEDGHLTVDTAGGNAFTDVKVQADGKILAIGQSGLVQQGQFPVPVFAVFRYTPTGQLDLTFGGGDGIADLPQHWDPESRGFTLSLLDDGRIVAGGEVYFGGVAGVARFDADGLPDPTLGNGPGYIEVGLNIYPYPEIHRARVIAEPDDGRIYIVGGDGSLSGDTMPGVDVFRFTVDGTIDPTFANTGWLHVPTWAGTVPDDLAILPSGKLLVAGKKYYPASGGLDDFYLRVDTNGMPDPNFGSNGIVEDMFTGRAARAIMPMPDDSFFVAGGAPAATPGGGEWSLLARFNSAGALDYSFGDYFSGVRAGTHAHPYQDMIRLESGQFLAIFNTGSQIGITRLTSEGFPETTFGNSGTTLTDIPGDELGLKLAVDPIGRALVAGSVDEEARALLARFTGDVAPTGIVTAHVARDLDGDGVRDAGTDTPLADRAVYVDLNHDNRFDPDVDKWALSDASGNVTIEDVPPGLYVVTQIPAPGWKFAGPWQGRYEVTVAGEDTVAVGDFLSTLFSPSPHLDTTFGSGGRVILGAGDDHLDYLAGIERLGNGKLVAAGYIGSVFTLLRFNADGSPDTTFGPSGRVNPALPTNLYPFSSVMALQPDGKILVSAVQGNPHLAAVIRFNANGTLDTAFGNGGGRVLPGFSGTYLSGIAVDSLGRIIAAANTNANSTDAIVARLTPAGQLDATFDADGVVTHDILSANDHVYGVIVQGDNKILLAGTTWDNHSHGYLLRLGEAGAKDATFGAAGLARLDIPRAGGTWEQVVWNDVAVMADGRIVAGGYAAGGFAAARYTSTGVLDSTFASGAGYTIAHFQRPAGGAAYGQFGEALALLPDGSIYIAGSAYTTTDAAPDITIARWRPDGTLEPSFGTGGKVIAPFSAYLDRAQAAVVDLSTGRLIVAGRTSSGDDAALLARFQAPAPARISGFIFDDTDGDGVRDAGENALVPGRTAYIDANDNAQLDPYERSFVTQVDGFWFDHLSPGTYRIRAVIPPGYVQTTPANNAAHVVTVVAGQQVIQRYIGLKTDGQSPYLGQPFGIGSTSGTIQFEDFDNGGEGVAYHDVESSNLGGAYRSTGVDIQATTDTGGGHNIAYVKAGEWLEYTLDVQQAGTYTLNIRLAAGSSNGKFHVEVGGIDKTGLLTVPNTGGFQNWTTLSKTGVALPAGQHVLRVFMDAAGSNGSVGNFNWLKITAEAAPPPAWMDTSPDAQYTLTSNALVVSNGNVWLTGDAASTHPNLAVSALANAVLGIGATQHLGSLDLAEGAIALLTSGGDPKTFVTGALTLANNASLDLKTSPMIVNYAGASPIGTWTGTTYTGLTDRIAAARNAPGSAPWQGFGITSSDAATSAGLTSLAIADASQALGLSGTQTTMWKGQAVDATSVLVAYTYAGDANLDGVINIDDYGRIDANVAVPGAAGWFNGDFNYDGKINIDDYGIIDSNISRQASEPLAAEGALAPPTIPQRTGATSAIVARSAIRAISPSKSDGELLDELR